MSFKQWVIRPTVVAAMLALAGQAHAVSTVDVDLAGWSTHGQFDDPENSFSWVDLGAGSQVLGFEYLGLSFTTQGDSWQDEFTLSVENGSGWTQGVLDLSPSGVDGPGTFGPASGAWGGAGSSGAPFTTATGLVKILVWEDWDDEGVDATVDAGAMRIIFQPVPEPSTYGMMALGLLGVVIAARRRAH